MNKKYFGKTPMYTGVQVVKTVYKQLKIVYSEFYYSVVSRLNYYSYEGVNSLLNHLRMFTPPLAPTTIVKDISIDMTSSFSSVNVTTQKFLYRKTHFLGSWQYHKQRD